jgi:hypothetical protein
MNTKILPLTAKKNNPSLAIYSITTIGACEYKDIAADCYIRNVPSLSIIQQLNNFNKLLRKFWHCTA